MLRLLVSKPFWNFCAMALATAMANAAVTVSDVPLFLRAGVTPNVILTVDDSGSMTSGYVPDAIGSSTTAQNSPRFSAYTFNGLYYNPRVTYSVPVRSDGVVYTTSFTTAYVNGFDTSRGSVNLSANGYQPVLSCAPRDASGSCTRISNTYSNTVGYLYTGCTATFSSTGTDRIDISGCTPSMPASGVGSPDLADGKLITVTGASLGSSNWSGVYTASLVSNPGGQVRIEVPNQISANSSQLTGVTFRWIQTSGTSTVNSPAFYHLYYADMGANQPSGCNANRDTRACYVMVVVGSR